MVERMEMMHAWKQCLMYTNLLHKHSLMIACICTWPKLDDMRISQYSTVHALSVVSLSHTLLNMNTAMLVKLSSM
jgi:hypothetical protein